jgi:hypothetical protein
MNYDCLEETVRSSEHNSSGRFLSWPPVWKNVAVISRNLLTIQNSTLCCAT